MMILYIYYVLIIKIYFIYLIHTLLPIYRIEEKHFLGEFTLTFFPKFRFAAIANSSFFRFILVRGHIVLYSIRDEIMDRFLESVAEIFAMADEYV